VIIKLRYIHIYRLVSGKDGNIEEGGWVQCNGKYRAGLDLYTQELIPMSRYSIISLRRIRTHLGAQEYPSEHDNSGNDSSEEMW
jgi:hypothetical protein